MVLPGSINIRALDISGIVDAKERSCGRSLRNPRACANMPAPSACHHMLRSGAPVGDLIFISEDVMLDAETQCKTFARVMALLTGPAAEASRDP